MNSASVAVPLDCSLFVLYIVDVVLDGIRMAISGEGEDLIRKPSTWHDTDRTGMREFRTTRMLAHTATAALTRSLHPRPEQKVQASPNPTGSRKSQGACRIASDRALRLPAVAFMPQRTMPVKRPKRSPLLAFQPL